MNNALSSSEQNGIRPGPDGLRLGLALGSGSSRGWAHIGILSELEEIGIRPQIITGCSIGAIVGASYAAGNLQKLQEWACSLNKRTVAGFFEFKLSLKGFVDVDRLHEFLNEFVCDDEQLLENLPRRFASVSTELDTGKEIWFTEGPVLDAVWASLSLPGLLPPIRSQGRWLVDGGLVNPVPVSVCRALGADIVLAVNLNADIVGKHFVQKKKPPKTKNKNILNAFSNTMKEYSAAIFPVSKNKDTPPGLFEAIASSIQITQDRITRSRMADDPPDIMMTPKLSHIGLLESYRANEAIREGREYVRRIAPQLQELLG